MQIETTRDERAASDDARADNKWSSLLRRIAPRGNDAIISMISDHADEQFERWGIDSMRAQATMLAHIFVETDYLTSLEENLNYSAPRLCEVWPNRFKSTADASPFAHNGRALACHVYGNRMGNRAGTDDGWVFRGRGLLQSTGRANSVRLGKMLKNPPETIAEWLTDPGHALECACALYKLLGVARYADAGDMRGSTKAINGGYTNLEERTAAYQKIMRILSANVASARAKEIDESDLKKVTPKELLNAGSRTIKGADMARSGLLGSVASIGGLSALTSTVKDWRSQIDSLVDLYHSNTDVIVWAYAHWQICALAGAVIAGTYFVWRCWAGTSLVIAARVDDARTGVNVGRI